MPAKLGPWLAAALTGAAALAVSFGISALLPEQYGAAGRLDVPAAAQRSAGDAWPDASQVNRWLAQPLPVRPLVKITLAEPGHYGPPQIVVAAEAPTPQAAADSVNTVLRTAQQQLQSVGAKFDEERHRALLTLLHHARGERNRTQRQLDQLVAQRMREVAAATPAAEVAPPESTGPELAPPGPVPTVRARNPLYDDLVRQIGEMEGRRAGLLQTMTPAHPVVLDLDWRLQQMRDQLSTSPEFTNAPDPTAVGPLPFVEAPPASTAVQSPVLPAQQPAESIVTLDDLREQRALVAAADLRLGAAIQQERAAWQQLSALRAALDSSVVLATVPTRPEPSVAREQIRWAGVLFALALSGATLWKFRPRQRLLRTAEDVRRSLKVPVLGQLSATPR